MKRVASFIPVAVWTFTRMPSRLPLNARTCCGTSSAVPGFSTRVPESDMPFGNNAGPPNWNASVLSMPELCRPAPAAAMRSRSAARSGFIS